MSLTATTIAPRRALVLALAGVTTLTEAAAVAGLVPDLTLLDLDVSIALLPALVLAAACGSRLLGRSTVRQAAIGYWLAAVGMLPVLGVAFWRAGRFAWYPGLVSSALGEELVYRLAIPAVIAAALRLGHVRPGAARIAGFVGAGLWFILLPGHREQITSPTAALPFIAFAALSAFIVFRSGSILGVAVGHAIANLLTVLMWQEAVPGDARSASLACVLALLVIAYGRPSRLTVGDHGRLLDIHTGLEVAAIDLCDGRPATAELSDGRRLVVRGRPNGTLGRSVTAPGADPPFAVPRDMATLADQARTIIVDRRQARPPLARPTRPAELRHDPQPSTLWGAAAAEDHGLRR